MYDWTDVIENFFLLLQAVIVAFVVVYPIRAVLRALKRVS